MPLVVVASGKGGVTKTTTTYALAAAMRESGHAPYMLDLDPGASLTENAGIIADGDHALAFLNGKGSIEELSTPTLDDIPIVPGTVQLLSSSGTLSEIVTWAHSLRKAAADHLIIVDTAQGLGLPATRAALLAADFIVVPMQAEPMVIKRSYPDVISMLKVFRRDDDLVRQFPLAPVLLFALTKHNGRLALSRQILDGLAESGVQISAYIPMSVTAPEASMTGRSTLSYAPKSPVSEGYRDLARVLIAQLNSQKLAVLA